MDLRRADVQARFKTSTGSLCKSPRTTTCKAIVFGFRYHFKGWECQVVRSRVRRQTRMQRVRRSSWGGPGSFILSYGATRRTRRGVAAGPTGRADEANRRTGGAAATGEWVFSLPIPRTDCPSRTGLHVIPSTEDGVHHRCRPVVFSVNRRRDRARLRLQRPCAPTRTQRQHRCGNECLPRSETLPPVGRAP